MAILICPVCQGTMRELNKHGVMIDTCTRCRGVWLDRGELEKVAALMAAGDQSGYMDAPPARRGPDIDRRDGDDFRRREHDRGRGRDFDDDDDDDDRRRYASSGRPQQSKMKRFLDFFD